MESSNSIKTIPTEEWVDKVLRKEIILEKSEKNLFTDLTEDEKKWVQNKRTCPDCLEGTFKEGPHGGLCVNVTCNHCGSQFNFGIFNNVLIVAHRI